MEEKYVQSQKDITTRNLGVDGEWSDPNAIAAHQGRYRLYVGWMSEYLEMEYRYLDMGCRNGEFLVQLREITGAWKLWGVEIHEEAAMLAGDRGIAVQNMDIHDLDMPDNFFDVVILAHILEHTYDPVQVLWQALRVTKPGGTLFIEIPLEPKPNKIPTDWGHWYTFQNPQMLLNLVDDGRLEILKQEVDPRKQWFRLLLKKKE